MGLTIHYGLRSAARSPAKIRKLIAGLRSRALDLPFKEVGDILDLSGAECDFNRRDRDDPHRWLLVQAGQFVDDPKRQGCSYTVLPMQVIGFSTWPGEGCEQANFGLCRYSETIHVGDPDHPGQTRTIRTRLSGWRWSSFCKTQYASGADYGGVPHFLRCHLAVVKLLDHAKAIGILEKVSDEGGFWESRDVRALARNVGPWNAMLDAFTGRLREWFGADVVRQP
jgi:hypothetical protein